MSNGRPAVTVIIPVFNRRRLLRRAIQSVISQSFPNFEIIVVDDCSSENVVGVVNAFNDSRITYIRHHSNRGGSAARNTGIRHAQGKYVAFLDSDDRWLPRKLERQVDLLEQRDESVGVVYTGTFIETDGTLQQGRVPGVKGNIYPKQIWGDHVSETSTWLVRKKCFSTAGTFDEQLPARQDYDMTLRLSQQYKYEFIREPCVVIHRDASGRISSDVEKRIAGSLMVLAKIEEQIRDQRPYLRRMLVARHLYAIARFCQKSGQRNEAIKFLLRSLKVFPFSPRCWLTLLALLGGERTFGYFRTMTKTIRKWLRIAPLP